MKDFPLVSIIMPNYNYVLYLEQSIQSVLQQTYPHFELIIIDDASTDSSLSLIKQFQEKDLRIKLIVNEKNEGVVFCRNKGIDVSLGEYVCFIDPDDLWVTNKIEIQLNALQNQNGNLCFTDIQVIDSKGIKLKNRKHFFKEYSYNSLLKRNFVPHSSLLLNKKILAAIRYQEIPTNRFEKWLMKKLRIQKIIHEDYALLLNIFKNVPVKAIYLNQTLVSYRVHSNNYSGNYSKKILSLYCIYKNTQNFNILESIYLTIRLAFFASLKNLS
jgi:glycosyltransferase involved in cell wall biosynthesis